MKQQTCQKQSVVPFTVSHIKLNAVRAGLSLLLFGLAVCPIWAMAEGVTQPLPSALAQVTEIEGDRQNAAFQSFFEVISANMDIFSQLPVKTALISKINFDLDSRGRSFYIAKSRTLTVASDCHNPKLPLSQHAYQAVGIHEFAHGIFEANLREHLKPLFLATAKNSDDYLNLVLSNKLQEADQVPVSIDDANRPFHELFADTLTVLLFQDPKILSQFFEACQDLKNERDFSFPYPLKNWNEGPMGGFGGANHRVFNPARFHIWNTFVTKFGGKPDTRSMILLATLKASESMLIRFYNEQLTYGQWNPISQEQLNRTFIERFDAFLADFR